MNAPFDQDSQDELEDWWRSVVSSDIARTVPKIKQYGTEDLVAMGTILGHAKQVRWAEDESKAAVYSILFYALGKIARGIAALERGEMPSEDTLFDLSIYAMMARSYFERGEL